MEEVNVENIDELIKAQTQIWNTSLSYAKAMCLKCAVELGIPDIINTHAKPMSLSDLVASLPIHPSKTRHHVYRLMRILTHSSYFTVDDQERYSLTRASRLLLKRTSFDSSSIVSFLVNPSLMKPFTSLSTWFNSEDINPFVTTNGETVWEHQSKVNELHDQAMASDSSLIGSVITIKCKEVFEGIDSLVDVGGGVGIVAKCVAESFPHINCIVLDQPHVIAHLKSSNNLNFLGGDMFQALPPADAFLFKWTMHDWDDEHCLKMLKNCKEGMKKKGKEDGKIIIIDIVLGNKTSEYIDHDTETQLFLDIAAMTFVKGKGRTEKEWANLFKDAGFTTYKIHSILGFRSLIEVSP